MNKHSLDGKEPRSVTMEILRRDIARVWCAVCGEKFNRYSEVFLIVNPDGPPHFAACAHHNPDLDEE